MKALAESAFLDRPTENFSGLNYSSYSLLGLQEMHTVPRGECGSLFGSSGYLSMLAQVGQALQLEEALNCEGRILELSISLP